MQALQMKIFPEMFKTIINLTPSKLYVILICGYVFFQLPRIYNDYIVYI